MKKLLIIMAIAAMPAHAGTAYYKGEVVRGMNKICFYEGIGGDYAITIGATRICPLTIQI